MHDIMDLEGRGIPAGFIASTEFIEAAKAQSRSLGVEPAGIFVQHPIQDRTDAEMVTLARQAIDRILGLIVERTN
ncbi:MAG: hypothetical protein A3H44_15495 [Gammaproteobacteria bacterium RIFCSPLOWO2_02_FULL_57_10]|nr:MAG: hypothetical protein A3H44_15495 [Gammaproteobacteria bacterium RIFCSPLOWO2_02_FULL_57_10]